MDAKALAKSKRAHSLHHKKKHQQHEAPKQPSVGSDDRKPTGKQAKDTPSRPQGQGQQANERAQKSHGPRPLPSNWGRYDEDFDLGSEEADASSSQPTEVVAPKSKGADYAHLISEANAQSQSYYSPDGRLFDECISDFTQDFGPMLAAKGKNILSWISDDSFEFEGKTSNSFEAPFLSLNLNALAEQLAKAKLSERLYLGPDLLPLELLDDDLWACDEDMRDPHSCTSKAEMNSGASSLSNNTNIQQHRKLSPSPMTVPGNIPIQSSKEEEPMPVKQNKGLILHSHGTQRTVSPEPITDSTSVKKSTFGAASAEEELDMLLSSFSDTKTLESSDASSSPSLIAAAPSSKNVKKGNIHDDIDDLLCETSGLTIIDDRWVSHASKVNNEIISSTVDPGSKSKLMDDFDSWLDTI